MEFLDRLRNQPDAVLAEEYTKHHDRLWHIVRFRMSPKLRGRVDPDDVLQEAYLAARERLSNYQPPMSFFVWLRLIVTQTLVDVFRRHVEAQMRDAGREQALQSSSGSLAEKLTGHLTSPSQAAARVEMVERLQQALDRIDVIDLEIILLRHFEELSNLEAAEVLGLSPKAASARYIRALERLKETMKEFPGCLNV
jgi:RNA polymerase sigma-70 factor (ECF subfamily)